MSNDLAIVGLGAAGSMALWRAAERGISVVGFEQFAPGHDRGSTHGETRAFFHIDEEGDHYLPLTFRARELWSELEECTGSSLFDICGGLMVGDERSEFITELDTLVAREGFDHERLDADAIRKRFPAHAVTDSDVAYYDPLSGFLRPERAVMSAITSAKATGNAQVHDNARVLAVREGSGCVEVVTADGTHQFERAIVAAGPWMRHLLGDLELPLEVRRIPITWFSPDQAPDEWFTPQRFPVFFRDIGSARGWGFPMISDIGVKVGLDGRYGEINMKPPEEYDLEVLSNEVDAAMRYTSASFNGLTERPTTVKSCMVTWADREDFIVAPDRTDGRIVVLSACSGRGMKHSPASGELAVQLAAGETPFADTAAFSLNAAHGRSRA